MANPRSVNDILPEPSLELDPLVQSQFNALNEALNELFLTFDAPSLVTGLTADANNVVILLRWNASQNTSLYRVYRNTSGDFGAAVIIGTVPASKTGVASLSYQDAADQAGATRYYWVQGVNERGAVGSQSAMVTVTNFAVDPTGTAVGIDAVAGAGSFAGGVNADATPQDSVAIGNMALTTGIGDVAIGQNAQILSTTGSSVAVGSGATVAASVRDAIAIGVGAHVGGGANASIAIGSSVTNSAANQLKIGQANSSTSFFSDVRIGTGQNGQFVAMMELTELTTIAAAAFTDTTIQIPLNALAFAVSVYVTVVIPTAATFSVGIVAATSRYGSGLSVAAGTSNPGTDDGVRFYGTARAIRITPNVMPVANTGRVRVVIHYLEVTAPTS